MNKTYQIKTNAIEGKQQVIDLTPAMGKAPVKVPAAPGARYELIDPTTKAAPDNIRVMRKGNDLRIYFDGDTEPGTVLENFYQAHVDEQAALVGRTEKGVLYEYIPESAASSAVVSHLGETGNIYGMALGGVELPSTGAAVGLLAPVVGFNPLLVGAGVLGAAAMGGGGGGSTPPPSVKLADASDSGTKGDNKTSDATPTLTGNAPAGSTATITVNGKTYPLTINADGSHNFTVPDADKLPDGTYTPVIEVTQNGKTTSYNGTAFTIDTKTSVDITNSGTAGTTKPISGTAEAFDTIEVKDASGALVGTTTADSNGKWSLTPTNVIAAGNVIATAKDAAGNTATDSESNLINGGKPLGMTLDLDVNNDGVINLVEKGSVNSTNVTVSFDNTKVSAGDVITVTEGSSSKSIVLTAADITAGKIVTTWSLPSSEGSVLTLKANVKDAKSTPNNVSPDGTDSATVNVAPTAKLADTSDSGTKGDNKTSDATPTLTGTAPAGSGSTITVNGKTYPLTVNADGSHSFTVPDTDTLPDGTYTPVIKVTQDGTTISYNGTAFTVDTKTSVSISNSGAAGTTKAISGTAEAFVTVEVKDTNGAVIGTTTADSSGKWSLTPASATAAGNITAIAKDAAGNTASDSMINLINGGKPLVVTLDMDLNNDGVINLVEKGNANATTVTVNFDNTKVFAGDLITVTEGNTSKTMALTAADIAAGKIVTSWNLPNAEGSLLSIKATVKDANSTPNNVSPDATDSATVDVVAPVNADLGLKLEIATDADNNGWINANELGTATALTSHATFDKTKAKAGDSLVFTATNGTTALNAISHKLTDTDITNGYVDVGFGKPGEGQTQTVNVNYVDAAGNAAADKVTDSAVLDTIATSNSTVKLTLEIATDGSDNDGWVNADELNGASTFTSHATFDKTKVAEGEAIFFSASNGTTVLESKLIRLTASDISKGYVDVDFAKPSDGQLQTVTAQYVDKAGNKASDKITDSATLDTLVPKTLGLMIDLDNGIGVYNNDGRISADEKGTATTTSLTVMFDKDKVSIGDVITLSDGTVTKTITLDQSMVDSGKATSTGWALPSDQNMLKVNAILKDAAGNSSNLAEDSVLIDTTPMTFSSAGETKSVLYGTTVGEISFLHGAYEKGTYKLHVGPDVFEGALDGVKELNKTFFTSAKTVNGTAIYFEFWDAAGNYSKAGVSITDTLTVDASTTFSTGYMKGFIV